MPISSGDPADLIRAYLAQVTNVPASSLPVPEGMGDLRARMLAPVDKMKAAAMDPGFVSRLSAGITPEDGGGGQGRMAMQPLDFRTTPVQQLTNTATPEDMFKFKDYVAEKAKEKERETEAQRIAREALERAKEAKAPPPARTTGVTPTPVMTPTQGPDTGEPNPNATVTKESFLKMAVPYALEIAKETGVDPRLIIAQAALESGWGRGAPGHNYFGIKAGPDESGQVLDTKEMVDGKLVPQKAKFRTYDSPQASFKHYGEKMKTTFANVSKAKSLPEQLIALGKSGYATDSSYLPKLVKIIESLPPDLAATVTAPPAAPPEPDTRARGGHIRDLLAFSRDYK